MDLKKELSERGVDTKKVASWVIDNPDSVDALAEGLRKPRGSTKFRCEKVLRLISAERPDLVCPLFDAFAVLLDSDNSFLRWGAILTVANLCAADAAIARAKPALAAQFLKKHDG